MFIEYLKTNCIFLFINKTCHLLSKSIWRKQPIKFENPLINNDIKVKDAKSSDIYNLRKCASNFLLILTTYFPVICVKMVNVNKHVIVINMYI